MTRNEIIGVVLAAGSSSRFGSNKCLHKLANGNEIALQAAINLRQHLDKVICIIPSDQSEIKVMFESKGFEIIENPSAEDGISTSIKAAIKETKNAKAWLMCLADMPNIKSPTYQTVLSELIQTDGIVIPCVNQKQGNPVGISARFYKQLMTIEGDAGAKQIFKQNQDSIHYVEANDFGVLQDIDTPSDFSKYTK